MALYRDQFNPVTVGAGHTAYDHWGWSDATDRGPQYVSASFQGASGNYGTATTIQTSVVSTYDDAHGYYWPIGVSGTPRRSATTTARGRSSSNSTSGHSNEKKTNSNHRRERQRAGDASGARRRPRNPQSGVRAASSLGRDSTRTRSNMTVPDLHTPSDVDRFHKSLGNHLAKTAKH